MTTQPPVGPLDSESVKLEDVLFFKLKDLILEQSEGEWTDEMIVRDAHHFANHLRPLFRLPSEAGEGAAEQYNQARRDFNRMRDDGSLSDEPTTPPTDPRLDRLKLAICGGEDVPGAIAAVTVEDCERFLVEERQRHEWSDTQQARLDRAIEALEKARAALHQHYVDWDGEPEDAVPLQLARSECDQALASIRGEA